MVTLKAPQPNYKVRVKNTLVRFGANGNANIEDQEIADILIKAGYEVVGKTKSVAPTPVVEEVSKEALDTPVEDVVEEVTQPKKKKKKNR